MNKMNNQINMESEFRTWSDSLTLTDFEWYFSAESIFNATERGIIQLAIAIYQRDDMLDVLPSVLTKGSLVDYRVGDILDALKFAIGSGRLNATGITWAQFLINKIEGAVNHGL